VSDPKKLLKPKGYLRQTVASAGKVYQPRITQDNVKVPTEEVKPKESFEQIHSAEPSTSKPEVKIKTPEVVVLELKVDIDPTDTFINKEKRFHSIPSIVYTLSVLSFLEVKVFVSQNPKEYFLYIDSSPITSPIYESGKSEDPNSSFPFPPHLDISSPRDIFPELHSQPPEVF